MPFLQKHLRPAEMDANRVTALLAALDGDDFGEREKASRELAKLGDLAGPAVRQALAGKPSPEARRRLEQLAGDWTSQSRRRRRPAPCAAWRRWNTSARRTRGSCWKS